MGKTLIGLSFATLVFLGIGTKIAPSSPMFWLASASVGTQIMRFILAALLLIQLLTNPPRWIGFRLLTGLVAISVGVWAIQSTYAYQLQFMDTLAFLGSSLAMGITAMERRPVIQTGKLKLTS